MLCVTPRGHESALPRLLAPALPTAVDAGSETFRQNREDLLEQLAEIEGLLDEAEAGGGPAAMERLRSRGKLPIRERIANVIDPNSPFLGISALAAYQSDYTVGGGMVVGIGVIGGTECVIMGNDPSVLAGALTPSAQRTCPSCAARWPCATPISTRSTCCRSISWPATAPGSPAAPTRTRYCCARCC